MRSQYKYPDGSQYDGEWNDEGQRHGKGSLKFADGALYKGSFYEGVTVGSGVMNFVDGSRYEGEFSDGKFDGFGIFIRGDGMRYEGEFKQGKVSGLGIITFADGTHGLPRNEGCFDENRITKRQKCTSAINRALQASERARNNAAL